MADDMLDCDDVHIDIPLPLHQFLHVKDAQIKNLRKMHE